MNEGGPFTLRRREVALRCDQRFGALVRSGPSQKSISQISTKSGATFGSGHFWLKWLKFEVCSPPRTAGTAMATEAEILVHEKMAAKVSVRTSTCVQQIPSRPALTTYSPPGLPAKALRTAVRTNARACIRVPQRSAARCGTRVKPVHPQSAVTAVGCVGVERTCRASNGEKGRGNQVTSVKRSRVDRRSLRMPC